MNLLDKRIIIVTGKGGTGKTTVCASLGLWAARSGKKTLICETNGTAQICTIFGRSSGGYQPVQVHPDLHVMSITSEEAMEDYVVQQIKVRQLYKLVFRNRVMGPFLDAVPGLHDAVHLGKVFDLVRSSGPRGKPDWDLVIVDAPSTGHGIHMFSAPRAMMDLTRTGPIYEGVKLVDDVISDPDKTALLLTCIPEEMPVNETIDLWNRVGEQHGQVAACILNEVTEAPFDDATDWDKAKPELTAVDDPAVQEAVQLTQIWVDRAARQDWARAELNAAMNIPVVDLPLQASRALGFGHLQSLSQTLGTCLEQQ